MKRSTLKKELKAKRAKSRRDPENRRGFRKIHIDGAVYQWRYYGDRVEIRPPGKLELKWIAPIWQLHEYESLDDWNKAHEDSDGDYGYAYECTPAMIKRYILEMRKATCGVQEQQIEGCGKTSNR